MRHGPRSLAFDLGLAAGGCLLVLPAVNWLTPVGDEDGSWDGWTLVVAFVASYAFARHADRLAAGLEAVVRRAIGGGSP
jgi:hypothetical protein